MSDHPAPSDLYQSLFKGRADTYAVRWEANDRSGYVPAYDLDREQYRNHKRGGGTLVSGDQSSGSLNGTPYTAALKGTQEGEEAMETTTEMLLSSSSESNITGTISSMGQDIPLTITISTKLGGATDQINLL
jgi:hypothetical protein